MAVPRYREIHDRIRRLKVGQVFTWKMPKDVGQKQVQEAIQMRRARGYESRVVRVFARRENLFILRVE